MSRAGSVLSQTMSLKLWSNLIQLSMVLDSINIYLLHTIIPTGHTVGTDEANKGSDPPETLHAGAIRTVP